MSRTFGHQTTDLVKVLAWWDQSYSTNGHSSLPIRRGRCFRSSFLQTGRRRNSHIHCLDGSDHLLDGGHRDRQVRRRTESPAEHASGGSSGLDIPQTSVDSGGIAVEGGRIDRVARGCWPPNPAAQVDRAKGSVRPHLSAHHTAFAIRRWYPAEPRAVDAEVGFDRDIPTAIDRRHPAYPRRRCCWLDAVGSPMAERTQYGRM